MNHNFQQLFYLHGAQIVRLDRIKGIMRTHLGIPISTTPISTSTISPAPIILPDPYTTAALVTITTVPNITTTTPVTTFIILDTASIPTHPIITSTTPDIIITFTDITPNPSSHPNQTTQSTLISDVIHGSELPHGDLTFQPHSYSNSSYNSASGSHTEKEIEVDLEPSVAVPVSNPQPILESDPALLLSLIFHPPSPDHATFSNHTSTPIDPLIANVLFTPPPPSLEIDPIPPSAPLRVAPSISHDFTLALPSNLSDDDK